MKQHLKINPFACKYFLLLVLLFPINWVIAQEDLKNLKFIKPEFNKLYFSKDSSSFTQLVQKLKQLEEGQRQTISITHIGGSHVQGGTWSNTFLSGFQNKFNTSGGGYFVFPYKLAKTNGQPYATSFTNGKWKKCRSIGKDYCQPLGLCAMNVSTNDSANYFGTRLTEVGVCRQANVIRVFHNFNNSFEFTLKNVSGFKRSDFSESGVTVFRLDAPNDSICFTLTRKDTIQKDFVLYGISLENDSKQGFYLAGLGANGASSSSFLRSNLLVPQLRHLGADIVVISLGVNDTQSKGFGKDDYIENYDSLITRIKQACPGVQIILTTTTDNYIKRKTSNKRTITAREAMFELMNKHNVAVWDLFSLMGGYKSMTKWNKAGLAARDKVHFTGKGYVLLGNLMFEAFMKSYYQQLSAKAPSK
ncbi:MAG: hypothetical protein IT236_10815 [Bacteroidia bacterium]|nr:hypothetical protein [Bacteroidia bacterium]